MKEENFTPIQVIVNNHFDENVNNRIIIINADGSTEYIADISGNKKDEFRHMSFFREYFKTHYLEDKRLQEYANNFNAQWAILYLLAVNYNAIIFMDTTREKDGANYGTIQLPEKPTELQEQVFLRLEKVYLKNFEEIAVFAHPILIDGIPDNKIYKIVKNSEFSEILEVYTNKKQR